MAIGLFGQGMDGSVRVKDHLHLPGFWGPATEMDPFFRHSGPEAVTGTYMLPISR